MQLQKKSDYKVEHKFPRFIPFGQPHKYYFNYFIIMFPKLRVDPTKETAPQKGFLLPQTSIAHAHNVTKKEHPSMKLAHELFSKGKGSFTRRNEPSFLEHTFRLLYFRL